MRNNLKSGSITIYLTLIFLSLLLVVTSSVDILRLSTAKAKAQRALDLSVQAAMTNYDTIMKNSYGIFVYDTEDVAKIVNTYYEANLSSDNELLYKFSNPHIEISEPQNYLLASPGIASAQILDYVKYRAPMMAIDSFLDKITAFKLAGSTALMTAQKISAVDDNIKDVIDAFEKLRIHIDGWEFDDKAKERNKLNHSDYLYVKGLILESEDKVYSPGFST